MVRQFTIGNIERIKKYVYLKNGAMYSVLVLGAIMMLHGFGWHIPEWVSPVATIAIVGTFWAKSVRAVRAVEGAAGGSWPGRASARPPGTRQVPSSGSSPRRC